MHKLLKVGLTGGIGTGKSTALDAFRRLGAGTISLDEMTHRFSRRGAVLHRAILRALGPRYLDPQGNLDRHAIATKVFSRPALRRRLERATHPILLKEMRREIARIKRPVFVADVPLLFEAGAQDDFDVTMVVAAPREIALRRATQRSRISRAAVLRRMRAQMPLARKASLADIVVNNRQSRKMLLRAIREYYRAFELIAH